MTGEQRELFLFGIIAVIIVVGAIWIVSTARRGHGLPSRAQRKKLSLQKQSCSYCRRKVNPKELSFYAAPGHGKVIGVCKACKPQAERQALMRL